MNDVLLSDEMMVDIDMAVCAYVLTQTEVMRQSRFFQGIWWPVEVSNLNKNAECHTQPFLIVTHQHK